MFCKLTDCKREKKEKIYSVLQLSIPLSMSLKTTAIDHNINHIYEPLETCLANKALK